MKQSFSLVWKEWREARAYLWIGLGVFLGLPLIGGLEYWSTSRRFYIETVPWVSCFGGVLAVFAAVGATCRDLSGRIEDFWRSVPVGITKWWSVKYVVGLAIVLAACEIPLLVDACTTPHNDTFVFLSSFLLFLSAVYSLAFAAGCLLRRTAHAAMVGLTGMLLIWFLPLILPPLAFLSFMDFNGILWDQWWVSRNTGFAAGMMGLAAIGILLAIVAVRRSWHIESGQKMIYGSISAAFLILCASASFQLGTNLPILQEIQIPVGEYVSAIRMDGNSGDIQTVRGYSSETSWLDRKIQITSSGVKLASPSITRDSWFSVSYDASLPDGSYVHYATGTENEPSAGPLKLFIWRFHRDGKKPPEKIASVQLWNQVGESNDDTRQYAWKDRLYILGISWRGPDGLMRNFASATRLAILDISDPLKPKLLSNTPFDFPIGQYWSSCFTQEAPDEHMILSLPPLPGLPARERLKLAVRGHTLEDDTLCLELGSSSGHAIASYRLETLSDSAAAFTKAGIYKPNLLQKLFRGQSFGQLQLQNGLLYEMQEYSRGENTLLPSVSVFDTRGPHPMRVVGHFAAPGASVVCPLPDGRALVGGSKLWLVGPPPNVSQ